MISSFIYNTDAALLCFFLFIGMLSLIAAGYFLHLKSSLSDEGIGAVEGSLFALLGLIMAFTFGMSGSRFESKRLVITEEANSIGTAYLRVDLYQSDSTKAVFRNYFKQYIEARIENYEAGFDQSLRISSKAKSDSISKLIWDFTTQQSRLPNNYIPTMQMVPALNSMIDIVTTKESAFKARVPDSILWLLFLMILSCSFLIGFSIPINKKVNFISIIGFVILSLLVVYVILDLDRPSRGLINLNEQTQVIIDLRKMLPK
jgi:Ca2+/Na+ antiporter